jgi:hypothetical protein
MRINRVRESIREERERGIIKVSHEANCASHRLAALGRVMRELLSGPETRHREIAEAIKADCIPPV